MKEKIKYRFKNKKTLFLIKIIDAIGNILSIFFKKKPLKIAAGKILIVRLDHIGDVVLTLPAVHALKKYFPGKHITVLVNPLGYEIVKADPNIDDIIVYDAPWFKRGNSARKTAFWKIVKSIRKEKFDLAVDFRGDIRNIFLMFLSKIPARIGYAVGGGGFLLTHLYEYPKGQHEIEKNNYLVKSVFPEILPVDLKIYSSKEDDQFINGFFDKNNISTDDIIVGIHPGAGCASKLWSDKKFAEVADGIIDRFPSAKVILTGSQAEKPMLMEIIELMEHSAVSAEYLTIGRLISLMKFYKLLITVDSAPLHIASALNIPTVALFSGTNDVREWSPIGEKSVFIRKETDCSGCELEICTEKNHECMKNITSSEVLNAVFQLLQENE